MSKKTKSRSAELASQRDAALSEAERITADAVAAERELTSYEEGRVATLTEQARALATEINTAIIDERLAEQRAAEAAAAAKAEKAERKATKAAERAANDGNAFAARAEDDSKRSKKAAEARNALGVGNVRVTNAEHTYRPGDDAPYSYTRDLVTNAVPWSPGWSAAHERLMRHSQEIALDGVEAERRLKAGNTTWRDRYFTNQIRAGMAEKGYADGLGEAQVRFLAQNRDLSTAAGAGGEWVPPLFLTELWVPYARPGRPFADSMTRKPLPPGTMSINIPVVTGGTTVASQGAQNTNVSDTDMTTEYDTFPVVTIAGAQILSLQLIERSPIAVDDAVFGDLHLAAAQELDRQCINGGLNVGELTGLLNTSGVQDIAFNTAPTTPIGGLYGALAAAKAAVADKRFLSATHAFMTPARWEYYEQQLDGNGRPLIVPEQNGAFILAQLAPDEPVNQGVTGGRVLSLLTIQDYMVPSNLGSGTDQDAIIVSRMSENWLYESPIIARALPQTYGQQLSVLVQCYFYAAATFARYPFANAYITGTSLTTPTYNV